MSDTKEDENNSLVRRAHAFVIDLAPSEKVDKLSHFKWQIVRVSVQFVANFVVKYGEPWLCEFSKCILLYLW